MLKISITEMHATNNDTAAVVGKYVMYLLHDFQMHSKQLPDEKLHEQNTSLFLL